MPPSKVLSAAEAASIPDLGRFPSLRVGSLVDLPAGLWLEWREVLFSTLEKRTKILLASTVLRPPTSVFFSGRNASTRPVAVPLVIVDTIAFQDDCTGRVNQFLAGQQPPVVKYAAGWRHDHDWREEIAASSPPGFLPDLLSKIAGSDVRAICQGRLEALAKRRLVGFSFESSRPVQGKLF